MRYHGLVLVLGWINFIDCIKILGVVDSSGYSLLSFDSFFLAGMGGHVLPHNGFSFFS